jgi:hypothetical protein
MALAELIQSDSGRMPYVRFERVAIEDKAASLAAGHYVAKDIDMANITPPYSKDIMKYKVINWFDQLKTDALNGRIPQEWLDKYQASYQAWQKGQELPLDGFPIKGWGVCSPAQQETLIKMHILTVEQLADVTHEGIQRIGMGGVDLKNKATAWLQALKKAGPVTVQNAALKKQVTDQTLTIEGMETKIAELTKMVDQLIQQTPIQALAPSNVTNIGINDLMGDD